MSHFIPDKPWSKIAADLSEFKGENYLVLVDYYSDWIGFDKMRDKTATETIATLLIRQFSRWELPHEMSLPVEGISTLRTSQNSVRGSR